MMGAYIVRRLLIAIPTLLGVSLVVFFMLRLMPGDLVDVLLNGEPSMTDEQAKTLRLILGLDVPVHIQYFNWITDILRGDFGHSLWSRNTVSKLLVEKAPITAELAVLSILVSLSISVPLGLLSAIKVNTPIDYAARLVAVLGLAAPNFWVAIIVLLVAAKYFHWFPPVVYVSPWDDPVANLQQMFLPAFVLGTTLSAATMRMLRASMLEVFRQEYISTARAKGLAEGTVVRRHALKNALIPTITIAGIQLGGLLGGTVIIEQVFGLPGLGWLLLNGINRRDYPIVQGAVLYIATAYILIHLIVDVMYGYFDPRIRYR